jgi:hypothetical protein
MAATFASARSWHRRPRLPSCGDACDLAPAAAHAATAGDPGLAAVAATDPDRRDDRRTVDDSVPLLRTEAPVFVLSGSRFTAFDAPEVGSNHVPRINNPGDIVGEYIRADAATSPTAPPPVDIPGAIIGTHATGINDRGQIVGRYGNPDIAIDQPGPI